MEIRLSNLSCYMHACMHAYMHLSLIYFLYNRGETVSTCLTPSNTRLIMLQKISLNEIFFPMVLEDHIWVS